MVVLVARCCRSAFTAAIFRDHLVSGCMVELCSIAAHGCPRASEVGLPTIGASDGEANDAGYAAAQDDTTEFYGFPFVL